MEIEETSFMEELMNGDCHVMTDTEYGTKRIRTRTQMSDFTQELHGVSFLLQRISIVASTQYLNFTRLDFGSLTGTD